MKIESVEVEYFYYNKFSMSSGDGLVHIKSLPYLSIVQSTIGTYGIKIDEGFEHFTNAESFFIAPSLVTQKITHHFDKSQNLFEARYLFLDVIINKKYRLDDVFRLPEIIDKNTGSLFNSLFNEFESYDCVCDKMGCLYKIVKHLIGISEENHIFRNKEIYPLIEFIRINYKENITVSEMADILKMSESNLYAVFKKMTGFSPIKYLNNYRLSVASDLLLQTNDSVRNIAERVGISDQFYFSKLFKAKYRKSPQQYRKNCMCSIDV